VLDGLSFKQEQSCLSAHTAPKPRFFLLILRRHLYKGNWNFAVNVVKVVVCRKEGCSTICANLAL